MSASVSASDRIRLFQLPVWVSSAEPPLISTTSSATSDKDSKTGMMAARMGIGTFSGEPTEWEDYVDYLENYCIAHDVKEAEKKRAILLSESGAATYKLIRSLVAPTKPNEVDYKDLLAKAKAHFAPTPSTIGQRGYKFNTRVLTLESVSKARPLQLM